MTVMDGLAFGIEQERKINRFAVRIPVFWRFQLSGWIAYLVLSFPLKVLLLGSVPVAVVASIFYDGLALLLTLAMRVLYRNVYSRNLSQPWNAAIVLVASLSASLVQSLCMLALDHGIAPRNAVLFHEVNVLQLYHLYFCACVFVGWSLLYFVIREIHDEAARDLRLAMADTARQRAELQLLRIQMDPHFLLNALNTMRAEISRPGQSLRDLVQGLADYLRFSLDNRDRDAVPLGDEFDAILGFLTVQKARFRDELEIDTTVDDSVREALVPGVFILPLVDNAIKYGRKTSPLPLRIRLVVSRPAEETLRIEVSNTGQWVDETRPRTSGGVGLENLRHRLDLLYPGKDCLRITKQDGWITVCVEIPIET